MTLGKSLPSLRLLSPANSYLNKKRVYFSSFTSYDSSVVNKGCLCNRIDFKSIFNYPFSGSCVDIRNRSRLSRKKSRFVIHTCILCLESVEVAREFRFEGRERIELKKGPVETPDRFIEICDCFHFEWLNGRVARQHMLHFAA